MTHGKTGVLLFVLMMLIMSGVVPTARAAEQGQQPLKQQATPTHPPVTSPQPAPVSLLEGTTWPVTVTPDELTKQKGEKPFEDTLIFKDGKVTMSACVKMGFAPSTYTASPIGDSWSFWTKQMSKDQGQTTWRAQLTGETIKGTMTWKKQDGSSSRYIFEGKKATSQKPS